MQIVRINECEPLRNLYSAHGRVIRRHWLCCYPFCIQQVVSRATLVNGK